MILNKLPNLRSRTVIREVSCQTSNSTLSLLMHSAWEATEIRSAYFTEEKTIALLSSMLSCELLRSKLDFFHLMQCQNATRDILISGFLLMLMMYEVERT